MPSITGAFLQGGLAEFGGPVVRAADVAGLSPADLVRSYGLSGEGMVFPESPEFVDVLLFEQRPLMRFSTPSDIGERPWPTYEMGFLRGPARAPVWNIAQTRVPSGSALWRLHADGRSEQLSVLTSPAAGWTGATGYYPPLHVLGPRARWRGHDLPADFLPDHQSLELVWVGDEDVPEGFEPVRPRIHRRVVGFGECDEIFEAEVGATYRGVPVRVLQSASDGALLLVEQPTWETVQALRLQAVEPGLFELGVPLDHLEDIKSVVNVWTPQPSAG